MTGDQMTTSGNSDWKGLVFIALHGMQMRSCDEYSVRLSVRQTREL